MNEEILKEAQKRAKKPLTQISEAVLGTIIDNIIKDKEIERLNNIINELEKDLLEVRQLTFTKYNSNEWNNCLSFNDDIKPMLDKLKELKEDE